jgi:hypothetical protein
MEVAKQAEKVKSVAVNDRAIVKTPPVVAHGYLDMAA